MRMFCCCRCLPLHLSHTHTHTFKSESNQKGKSEFRSQYVWMDMNMCRMTQLVNVGWLIASQCIWPDFCWLTFCKWNGIDGRIHNSLTDEHHPWNGNETLAFWFSKRLNWIYSCVDSSCSASGRPHVAISMWCTHSYGMRITVEWKSVKPETGTVCGEMSV